MRSLGLCCAAAALSACGADATVVSPVQTDGTGPKATALAVVAGAQATCVSERRVVETAIETYFAMNGTDPATLDDLVPDMLRESVSPRWSMAPDPAGGTPIITGVGICEGA
ncbi:MAG: hypothetical protein HY828_12275 [Actinobacteria bacterium]|nr:hypothetical protein [Actinomycetota bacterium]